jgi:2-dehydro-3-deoxyphosphooctonate aldolase (KDO 8-P synthase)
MTGTPTTRTPATVKPFTILAGPCVLEGEDGQLNQHVATELKAIIQDLSARFEPIQFYFKSSYDKANRSSNQSYRGPGVEAGMRMLHRIKTEVGVPIVTDVHDVHEVDTVAQVADMLQIPAFLCRQTNLLEAAARTGLPVNIKKGQFLSPQDVQHCANKVISTGNSQVIITERGNSFGYNTLVVDMRVFPIVHELGLPILFDATHSVQQPGGLGTTSGGQSQYAPTLAYAAVAAGCDGLFFETHPTPATALSDGPNMIPLAHIPEFLTQVLRIRQAIKAPQLVAV